MPNEKRFTLKDKKKVFFDTKKENFGNNKAQSKKNNKFSSHKKFDETKSKDRIAKRLAILGIASRREAEKLVLDGKVKINGVECKELYQLVNYEDKISVNGKEIVNKPIKTKIYIMNKTAGYVTTNKDPQGRKTIFELIPSKFGRLIAIGRLDYNTEGLLLLTNNGELARIMEMPATGLKRVYYAKVVGDINDNVKTKLAGLKKGINIEGTEYGKMIVEIESYSPTKATLKIIIFEGKNNEIRRVMWHLGLKVIKLTRVQYGEFRLNGLPAGCVQESHLHIDLRQLEKQASRNIKKYNAKKENTTDIQDDQDKKTNNNKKTNTEQKQNVSKKTNDTKINQVMEESIKLNETQEVNETANENHNDNLEDSIKLNETQQISNKDNIIDNKEEVKTKPQNDKQQ